jgi:hypothetical protein
VYGTSGGALTGCLLFLDIDLDALAEYVFICVAKARSSWRGKFLLRHYCRGAIEQFCTRDAHKILQGRFEISITRIFPWYKNLRVNQFPSYEFLVRALLCSACLVPLAGLPMWLPGYGLCFDGGVSDFQLFKGLARNGTFCKLHCRKTNPKDIVVVCPFYSSRADIRPSKFVPIWWAFFPPEPYKLKELFELGTERRARLGGQAGGEDPGGLAQERRGGGGARRRRRRAAEPASPRTRARAAARRSRRGRRAMTASRATGSGAAARRRPPRRRADGAKAGCGGVARLGAGFQLAAVDLRRAAEPARAAASRRRRRAARLARVRDARDGGADDASRDAFIAPARAAEPGRRGGRVLLVAAGPRRRGGGRRGRRGRRVHRVGGGVPGVGEPERGGCRAARGGGCEAGREEGGRVRAPRDGAGCAVHVRESSARRRRRRRRCSAWRRSRRSAARATPSPPSSPPRRNARRRRRCAPVSDAAAKHGRLVFVFRKHDGSW